MAYWPGYILFVLFFMLVELSIYLHRTSMPAIFCFSFLTHWYQRMLQGTMIEAAYFWKVRTRIFWLFWPLAFVLLFFYPRFFHYALFFLFSPEFWLYASYVLAHKNRHKEMRFLKRLFILNGSVEPVTYDEVLSILRSHAFYLRNVLQRIESERQRNGSSTEKIYAQWIDTVNDLDIRLFLETLSQADCVHLAEGVRSMETDIKMDKLIRSREVLRRRDTMELMGIFFGIVLAGLMIFCWLLPWLNNSQWHLLL